MGVHEHSAWCDHFSPSKIRWFHTTVEDWFDAKTRHGFGPKGTRYGHFDLLRAMVWGRSADDTEAMDYCYQRVVVQGARSASGLWCVCLNEDAPATVSGRGQIGGDGSAALVAAKASLEHAADTLPISWTSTQRIFEAQARDGVYRARYGYYRRNQRVREIDRWLEPKDPISGYPRSTALTAYLMSLAVGGAKTECAWAPVSLSPAIDSAIFRSPASARSAPEALLLSGRSPQPWIVTTSGAAS